jgi:hypothetical protein
MSAVEPIVAQINYFPVVAKLQSQLEAAGPASSHLIRALTGLLGRLDLPKNAYRLTLTSYGLSGGERRFAASMLRLLSVFNKRRMSPDVGADDEAKHKAVQYMSNVVHQAVKDYQKTGYGYLFRFKSGYIDEKTGERVPSQMDWPLFAIAKLAVRRAYERHEEQRNWRGMTRTIDAEVDRIFSRLRKVDALQPEVRKSSVQNQNKAVVGRMRSRAQKLIDSGDAEGLAQLRRLAESTAVELQLMSSLTESDSNRTENHDLTMLHGAGGGGGDIDETDPNSNDREVFAGELEKAVGISNSAIAVFEQTKLATISTSWLDDNKEKGKQCVGFERPEPVKAFKRRMVSIFARHLHDMLSVTFRPGAVEGFYYVQLDDLTSDELEKLKPHIFIGWRSSDERFKQRCYQAWLCVEGGDSKIARRIKRALEFPVDKNASGSARLPGSFNFKPDYGPEFPRVETVYTAPGRVITLAELEGAGMLAEEEKPAVQARAKSESTKCRMNGEAPQGWPRYEISLQNAARKDDGTPDRSDADWRWCMAAVYWGFEDVEEIATQLMHVSAKAAERGRDYALATADRAAKAARGEL